MNKTFRHCKVLINPERSPVKLKVLKKVLKQKGAFKLIVSKSRMHFIDSVNNFYMGKDKYQLIWGGDGSIHDAINTLVRAKEQNLQDRKKSIGFFRGGSGNGYHDSYEVPSRISRQIRTFSESIAEDYVVDVDLLKFKFGNTVIYGQLAGFGFDVLALSRREKKLSLSKSSSRVRSGLFNYFFPALITFLIEFPGIRTKYTLDLYRGVYEVKRPRENIKCSFETSTKIVHVPMIEIGKRPYYGNRFKVCPDAICNNGYMDLYLYNLYNKISVLKN